MTNPQARLQGRVFPPFDTLNSGIHGGAHNNNDIDQNALADSLEYAANLLRTKQIKAVGGGFLDQGYEGQPRSRTVTIKYVLPPV